MAATARASDKQTKGERTTARILDAALLRLDEDGENPLEDNANEVFEPERLGLGGVGVDPSIACGAPDPGRVRRDFKCKHARYGDLRP